MCFITGSHFVQFIFLHCCVAWGGRAEGEGRLRPRAGLRPAFPRAALSLGSLLSVPAWSPQASAPVPECGPEKPLCPVTCSQSSRPAYSLVFEIQSFVPLEICVFPILYQMEAMTFSYTLVFLLGFFFKAECIEV